MEPITLVALLAVAFAAILALQTLRGRARMASEDKVLKGYFLLGLSGLMAKIAMADGTVADSETEMATRFFNRMELTDAEKAMCVGNFLAARKDGLTPRDHAKRFLAYANSAACEFLYDMLWRLSRADGVVEASEDALLKEIASFLGLPVSAYEHFKTGVKAHYSRTDLEAAGVPASLVALARA